MNWSTDFYFDLPALNKDARQAADLYAPCHAAREKMVDIPGGETKDWDALSRWECEGGAIGSPPPRTAPA